MITMQSRLHAGLARSHAAHRCALRPRLAARVAIPRCSAGQEGAAGDRARRAKKAAARLLVDRYVCSNSLVALGGGDMVFMAVEEIGSRLADGRLQNVTGVATCDVVSHEAAFHGVPLAPEARAAEASLVIAQADQLDAAANAALVGTQAEPTQPEVPRLLSALSKGNRLVLLAEESALVSSGTPGPSGRLSGPLPVWLEADEWEEGAEELDDIFLGDAEIWRRASTGDPETPRGGDHPFVSSQGHTIVDVRFYECLKLFGEDVSYDRLAQEIGTVKQVVATGLLLGRAEAAVVARAAKGAQGQGQGQGQGQEGSEPLVLDLPCAAAPAAAQ